MAPIYLHNRGILQLTGKDCILFLDKLMTQSLSLLRRDKSLYGSLLSPQGRYLFDFFIIEGITKDTLYLEMERDKIELLQRRLEIYRLRADVHFQSLTEERAVVAWIDPSAYESYNIVKEEGFTRVQEDQIFYADPRQHTMGIRAIMPKASIKDVTFGPLEDYLYHRLSQGIPETEFISEKSIPLEWNLDELNAICWKKGCYLGQELTTRTKHRGEIRKRLLPVHISPNSLHAETLISYHDKEVGVLHSAFKDKGLALLRLDDVYTALQTKTPFMCGSSRVTPIIPPWLTLKN